MTRGELTSTVNLRVTDKVREKLDKIAQDRRVKVAVVVREFIDDGLWMIEVLRPLEYMRDNQ